MVLRWSRAENYVVDISQEDGDYLCSECGAFGEDDEYFTDGDDEFCAPCYDNIFGLDSK